jgi:aspartyl-tRNA(Asn)/glutamyl-tRNA(Gln) amidotransferase subunit C
MKITHAEVVHIADLARLELAEEEIHRLQADLSQILEYVDQLNQLDTDDVPPTAHVVAREDVLREDVTRPSLPSEDVLANAPQVEEGYFRVHAVLPRGEQ